MNHEKKLTITIPEELHLELKMLAVLRKTTMKDIILKCVKKEIQINKESQK
jgi:hypothetical protein